MIVSSVLLPLLRILARSLFFPSVFPSFVSFVSSSLLIGAERRHRAANHRSLTHDLTSLQAACCVYASHSGRPSSPSDGHVRPRARRGGVARRVGEEAERERERRGRGNGMEEEHPPLPVASRNIVLQPSIGIPAPSSPGIIASSSSTSLRSFVPRSSFPTWMMRAVVQEARWPPFFIVRRE